MVIERLNNKMSFKDICDNLTKAALISKDNMSIILVALRDLPFIEQSKVEKPLVTEKENSRVPANESKLPRETPVVTGKISAAVAGSRVTLTTQTAENSVAAG